MPSHLRYRSPLLCRKRTPHPTPFENCVMFGTDGSQVLVEDYVTEKFYEGLKAGSLMVRAKGNAVYEEGQRCI
eukprot:933901-Rhodomonas_salina.1